MRLPRTLRIILHQTNCTFQLVAILGKEYLILEYADQGSLEDRLAREVNVMPTKDCVDIFKQLCLGLEYLHGLEIAHRDIKPANLFMCSQNRVKLGDFGFAASIHDAELGKDCGSPQFAAPELFFGDGSHDGRPADMWAAGVTLFRMVRVGGNASCISVLDIVCLPVNPLADCGGNVRASTSHMCS